MVNNLIIRLHALFSQPYIQLLIAGLGLLICFFLLELRTLKWKRKCHSLTLVNATLEERLFLEQQHAQEKQELLEKTSRDVQLQFKDLAQQIFEEKSRTFSRQNFEKLDIVLRPFADQISSFRERVDTIFTEETKERASLKQEILLLRELNQQINQEAANLSRAISGNRKLQGTWGELVLEKLLEQSGLRKNHEYEAQAGHRDQDNKLFKPDIIIHLPGEKDIVIDSKVSLSAWSRYVATEDEKQRAQEMADHLKALRNHLKTLDSKDYSSLKGLRSLDFVLMFVPIDSAFMTAIQQDDNLINEMYSRRVIIVTPTTLLATLRIIEHIWQLERQNRNALEIAHRASLLYDKFRGFLEDMEKLGKQLNSCQDSYDSAMNKMSRGRGNLVSQASIFPELGVKIKKELAKGLTDRTTNESSTPN
ncbi:MAG: DNA recombination protein RmuC [Desulfobacterales bacterium]|nr:DNA recombination protein RmuC [Desulfobacterales bacterium]